MATILTLVALVSVAFVLLIFAVWQLHITATESREWRNRTEEREREVSVR